MKLCINCKHFDEWRCQSPNNGKKILSPVDGSETQNFLFQMCSSHRTGILTGWLGSRMHKLCGAEGRWFEPKTPDK
jgi:hypothetical protein